MAQDYAAARLELARMIAARELVMAQLRSINQRVDRQSLAYAVERTNVARVRIFHSGENSYWGKRERRLRIEGRAIFTAAVQAERAPLLAKLDRQDRAIDRLCRRWGFNEDLAPQAPLFQSS